MAASTAGMSLYGTKLWIVRTIASDYYADAAHGSATLSPNVAAWYVDVHQYRIEALGEDVGKPTPEGIHRDGADWVLASHGQPSQY